MRGRLPVLVPALVAAAALGYAPPLPGQPTLASPYRDQQFTRLRGMTDREANDLREGRGMGLARAAELNGYPGPRHVLDAVEAGHLTLSSEQVAVVRRLFDQMSREARRLGAALLDEERALETAFGRGTVTEAEMRDRVRRIAVLLGEVRAVHLQAHLATRALMSEAQIRRYQQIRGYADNEAPAHRGRSRPHQH
jgi:hypothetical protein